MFEGWMVFLICVLTQQQIDNTIIARLQLKNFETIDFDDDNDYPHCFEINANKKINTHEFYFVLLIFHYDLELITKIKSKNIYVLIIVLQKKITNNKYTYDEEIEDEFIDYFVYCYKQCIILPNGNQAALNVLTGYSNDTITLIIANNVISDFEYNKYIVIFEEKFDEIYLTNNKVKPTNYKNNINQEETTNHKDPLIHLDVKLNKLNKNPKLKKYSSYLLDNEDDSSSDDSNSSNNNNNNNGKQKTKKQKRQNNKRSDNDDDDYNNKKEKNNEDDYITEEQLALFVIRLSDPLSLFLRTASGAAHQDMYTFFATTNPQIHAPYRGLMYYQEYMNNLDNSVIEAIEDVNQFLKTFGNQWSLMYVIDNKKNDDPIFVLSAKLVGFYYHKTYLLNPKYGDSATKLQIENNKKEIKSIIEKLTRAIFSQMGLLDSYEQNLKLILNS